MVDVVVLVETVDPALVWRSLLLGQTALSLSLLDRSLLVKVVLFLCIETELAVSWQAGARVRIVIKR